MAAAVDVLKSPSDRKSYRYLKLENGMSVLLIHDPEIKEQGAAQGAGGMEVRGPPLRIAEGAPLGIASSA
jgi:hypothetical protein